MAVLALSGCGVTNPPVSIVPGDGAMSEQGATQPVPGVAGPQGEPGVDGMDGLQGAAGIPGPVGPRGPQGETGPPGQDGINGLPGQPGGTGPAGPTLFDVFVDSFMVPDPGNTGGGQSLLAVEPSLGLPSASVMFRVAIPQVYDPGNDVIARIFFSRSGVLASGCFVMAVDIDRHRSGLVAQPYGDTRWVRIDAPDDFATFGETIEAGAVDAGLSLVIDVPLNTNAGLGLPGDLAAGDLLDFRLATWQGDGRDYKVLGVELMEAQVNSGNMRSAQRFTQSADITCARCLGIGADCNNNGSPDDCDVAFEVSMDCNRDGIPDECEICDTPPLASPPASLAATPFEVLWWDSTSDFAGEAPDALRQAMANSLTNFGGGWFNATYVSTQTPGTLATQLAFQQYDVIVFDATKFSTEASSFNARDLEALVVHYTAHPNVLLDGSLYIRNVNINEGTVFPGPNGATGKLLANEVFQLGARGGGVMIGTAHDCCHSDANMLLTAMIDGAGFAGRAFPSLTGQFTGDDLTEALASLMPVDVFTHWLAVPSEAIAPTGTYVDALGNTVTLSSQVNVASLDGSAGVSFISSSWQPGTVPVEHDCNANGVLDLLDLDRATSDDCNANGTLDECEAFCVEPAPLLP